MLSCFVLRIGDFYERRWSEIIGRDLQRTCFDVNDGSQEKEKYVFNNLNMKQFKVVAAFYIDNCMVF